MEVVHDLEGVMAAEPYPVALSVLLRPEPYGYVAVRIGPQGLRPPSGGEAHPNRGAPAFGAVDVYIGELREFLPRPGRGLFAAPPYPVAFLGETAALLPLVVGRNGGEVVEGVPAVALREIRDSLVVDKRAALCLQAPLYLAVVRRGNDLRLFHGDPGDKVERTYMHLLELFFARVPERIDDLHAGRAFIEVHPRRVIHHPSRGRDVRAICLYDRPHGAVLLYRHPCRRVERGEVLGPVVPGDDNAPPRA